MIFLVVSFWPQVIPRVGIYVSAAISLVAIYGFACLYTKRLHDLGRSGWWQLLGWAGALTSLGLAAVSLAIVINPDLAARISADPRRVLDMATGFSIIGTMACLGLHVLLGVLRADGREPLRPRSGPAVRGGGFRLGGRSETALTGEIRLLGLLATSRQRTPFHDIAGEAHDL